MYFAVECQDYAYYPAAGDPIARLHTWVEDAKKAGVEKLRLAATYFGDAPCLWWPNTPTVDPRIPAVVDAPYPTFVLTATLDPATPLANAMRIYSRMNDAYLFVQTGGPHVIFGRGLSCPDDAITAFLGADVLPATRINVCDGAVADPYVANPLRTAASYGTASEFATSIEDTLLNSDDYNYRFDTDPISLGCDRGGALTMRAGSAGTRIDFTRCAYTPGLAMTGNANLSDDGSYRLSVRIGSQSFLYTRDADGARSRSAARSGASPPADRSPARAGRLRAKAGEERRAAVGGRGRGETRSRRTAGRDRRPARPGATRGKTVHGEAANAGHRVLAPDDAEVEAYLETALNAPAPERTPNDGLPPTERSSPTRSSSSTSAASSPSSSRGASASSTSTASCCPTTRPGRDRARGARRRSSSRAARTRSTTPTRPSPTRPSGTGASRCSASATAPSSWPTSSAATCCLDRPPRVRPGDRDDHRR